MRKEKKLKSGLDRLFSTPKPADAEENPIPAAEEKNEAVAQSQDLSPHESVPATTPAVDLPPVLPVVEEEKAAPEKPAAPAAKAKTRPAARKKPAAAKKEAGVEQKQPEPLATPAPEGVEKEMIPATPSAELKPEVTEPPVETAIVKQDDYSQSEHIVVFSLAGQQYGINITLVESIIKVQAITEVPGAPYSIEGVTNLRGKVLPVINMHQRLGLGERQIGIDSRIVVATINDISAGMVVDQVNAVLMIGASDIEPPSPVVTNMDVSYIKGVAKTEQGLIVLLDLKKLLNSMDTRSQKRRPSEN